MIRHLFAISALIAAPATADTLTQRVTALEKRVRALEAPAPVPTPAPTPVPAGKPVIVAEGDSISMLWNGSYTGLFAASHLALDVRGFAVGGARISDVGGNGLEQRLPKLLAAKPAVVTVLIGANDLGDGTYATPEAWLDAFWSYIGKVKASGAKVAVGTVLPICMPAYADYTKRTNERRAIVNPAIRAAVGTRIDAVIDFAAEPAIGVDAAACGAAYKDGMHPADPVQPRMAAIYGAAVDQLLAEDVGDAVAPPVLGDVTTIPASIPSNFDVAALTGPAWETGMLGAIPPSSAPDVVGAFRFICSAGQISYDDPIVYPGQPGKSHLHQFFGNTLANARSTYASLRTSGDSTCVNHLNRSAYWMPAMLSAGTVLRPDYVSIYYKRRPASDPYCQTMGKACVALPRGLRFIFGYDMITGKPKTGAGYFNCQGPGAVEGHYPDIATMAASCPPGAQIGAVISAPNCWDGKRIDSANHRDHVAYSGWYDDDGKERCPSTHPYVIPTFTLGAWFTVPAAGIASLTLSSDDMGDHQMTPGSTFHADWWGAWDDATMVTWTANCIDKMLNCSGGDLGDGRQLIQVGPLTYKANPATLPIPARGGN